MNFNQDFSIGSSPLVRDIEKLTNEENYFDYIKTTGMQKENQIMMAHYASKIHESLKGKDKFTSSEIEKVLSDLKHL